MNPKAQKAIQTFSLLGGGILTTAAVILSKKITDKKK